MVECLELCAEDPDCTSWNWEALGSGSCYLSGPNYDPFPNGSAGYGAQYHAGTKLECSN
jgi:hypothetical protein